MNSPLRYTTPPQTPVSTPKPSAAAPVRVVSIDALRGFDMFWIVGGREVVFALVSVFAATLPAAWVQWLQTNINWTFLRGQMDHMEWDGFSGWDLIMPLFVFIVGAAMPFSFAKRREQGKSSASLYGKVIRRVLILWVLGMIAQGNLLKFDVWIPQLADPNVQQYELHLFSNTLQAIAVGYLVAAIAIIHLPVVGQAVLAGLLVVGYWAIMQFVSLGGIDAGVIEPERNIALFIDQTVLGAFRDGTTYTWILGGIGFAATTLLGAMAGHLLRTTRPGFIKFLSLLGLGLAGIALGLVWHGHFSLPGMRIDLATAGEQPFWQSLMIKHIWSASMILYAAGWSFLLLAVFYLVIDLIGLRAPFILFTVIGANAIFAYMAVRLIPFKPMAETWFGGLARYVTKLGETAGSYNVALGQAIIPLATFGFLWILLAYMYRKGIFVRV